MKYTEFLAALHEKYQAADLYFEIGCRQGRSLNLSKAKNNIAVDPEFNITWPILSPTQIYKKTSDDFFSKDADRVLKKPIDIAFIDGMHLSEFALRDFINVERFCQNSSLIIFDDVLPYRMEIASRTRKTNEWTGDIYKLIGVLKEYRPDLSITVVDIEVKGLMLVRKLDPNNNILANNYQELETQLLENDAPVITEEELRLIASPIDPVQALEYL